MSDSDWDVRHSTSGYIFMLCVAVISWASKRQTSVALSSCEAEIVAGSEAAKEAIHQSGMAKEYGVAGDQPIDLFMDNESGIRVAYNPEHFGRMKHVDRRHFFISSSISYFHLAKAVLTVGRTLKTRPRVILRSCLARTRSIHRSLRVLHPLAKATLAILRHALS